MKKLILLLISITIISAGLSGQAVTKKDLKQLDNYYAKMVEDWDIPSVSIGIVKDGKMIFSGNYGVLEEGKDAGPDKNTLYAIASNSKAFTSTLIGMPI